MDFIKPIALFFVSPLNITVLLAAIAVLLWRGNKPQTAHRCGLLALTVFIVFSQPYVANLLLYPLEFGSLSVKSEQIVADSSVDVIYVPACYYETKGEITEVARFSPCSLQRLTQAAILAKQTTARVVVTGGHFLADKEVAYADKAKSLLMALGVAADSISAIAEGTTTMEEIVAARELFANKHVLVVSSATHGYRLQAMFTALAKRMDFYPVDYNSNGDLAVFLSIPSASALESSHKSLYEYAAIIKHILTENS